MRAEETSFTHVCDRWAILPEVAPSAKQIKHPGTVSRLLLQKITREARSGPQPFIFWAAGSRVEDLRDCARIERDVQLITALGGAAIALGVGAARDKHKGHQMSMAGGP